MKSQDLRIGLVLLIFAIAVPFVLDERYAITQITLFFIWATVVTQWNLVFGVAGIFSLAQMALFAVGAYTSAILAHYFGWSIWETMPVAALCSVIVSILIGMTCLRLRGPYVALLTFAIAQAMYVLIITDVNCYRTEGTVCVQLTGGVKGFARFGDFGFRNLLGEHWYIGNYFVGLTMLILGLIFSIAVINSPLGYAFQALRDNKGFAMAHGINRFKYQLIVFAASAFFTGLAGSFYAGHFKVVGPNILYMPLLVYLVAMMVLGGMGRAWGPITGAALLMLADEGLKEVGDIRNIGIGLVMIVCVILLPEGVVGAVTRLKNRLHRADAG